MSFAFSLTKFKISLTLAVSVICLILASGVQAQNLPRDCDDYAIFKCGALTREEVISDYNSNDEGRYSDIKATFSHFGISSADIANISSDRVTVKKDNTVWFNGQLIGVNARTAGRHNKPGSTPIPGTGAYERPPSASFNTDSLDALLGYRDGVPAFAVLSACGNPVVWDMPPSPKIEMEKLVRPADNTKYVDNDTFANNSTITYLIIVRNTGNADATNVVVKDTLPASHSFVNGSVYVNQVNAGAAGDAIVGNGYTLPKAEAGATKEITFFAKVNLPADKCGDNKFTNKAVVTHDQTSKEDTTNIVVRLVCAFKCEGLSTNKTALKPGEQAVLTATASRQNVTINSYEFKMNGQVVQNTSSHTYTFTASNEGSFRFVVTVKTSRGDNTSTSCEVKIDVNKPPQVMAAVTTTPPPPALPKTGAASLAGIFTLTSLLGTAAHQVVSRLRR